MMSGRFGKIVLVVLGVILMVMFLLPAGMNQFTGTNFALGELDGQRVRLADANVARGLIATADQIRVLEPQSQQLVPLTFRFFGQFAQELTSDTELAYVLLAEARRQGIRTPLERVEQELELSDAQVRVGGRRAGEDVQSVPFARASIADRERYLLAAQAVFDLRQSFVRFADIIKISGPQADYQLARFGQEVDLGLVAFAADDFLDAVPAPTDAEAQEHLQRFADNPPGRVAPGNAFGHGYRLPYQVKLDYAKVARAPLEQAARDGLRGEPVRPRVERLFGYFSDHRDAFPATPPATRPADDTAEDDAGDTAGDGGGLPDDPEVADFLREQSRRLEGRDGAEAWQAFVASYGLVEDRWVADQADVRQTDAVRRLRDAMAHDFRQHLNAEIRRSAGEVTAAAATRAGVPVDAPDYLERTADWAAQQSDVRAEVYMLSRNPLPVESLADAGVVGPVARAVVAQDMRFGLPLYVRRYTLDLLDDRDRSQAERTGDGLERFQPSQLMVDLDGNEYVFRVTDARRSRPLEEPSDADLAAAREVLRRERAHDLARAEALRLAESGASLRDAAGDRFVRTGPFVPEAGPDDEDLLPDPAAARDQFATGVVALTAGGSGIIDVPAGGRVFAAEVLDRRARFSSEQELAAARWQLREQLRTQAVGSVARPEDFFDFRHASERVGYRSRNPERDEA